MRRVALGDEEAHVIVLEAAHGAAQRVQRRAVEPLAIIDRHEYSAGGCRRAEDAADSRVERSRIGRRPRIPHAQQRCIESLLLRRGEAARGLIDYLLEKVRKPG